MELLGLLVSLLVAIGIPVLLGIAILTFKDKFLRRKGYTSQTIDAKSALVLVYPIMFVLGCGVSLFVFYEEKKAGNYLAYIVSYAISLVVWLFVTKIAISRTSTQWHAIRKGALRYGWVFGFSFVITFFFRPIFFSLLDMFPFFTAILLGFIDCTLVIYSLFGFVLAIKYKIALTGSNLNKL